MIAANKMSNVNTSNAPGERSRTTIDQVCDVLAIRPLSARSVILSALLGTHPPRLPVAALVALTERFGIRPGTARTALSRLLADGEVEVDHGGYRLAGRLLQRQQQQDLGRSSPPEAWDGRWHAVVVTAERRTVAERRSFRSAMLGARMGELRPDTWMRPANLPAPPPTAASIVLTGDTALGGDTALDLVARLWPLDELRARADTLLRVLDERRDDLDDDDPSVLPVNFVVSAAAVRFLRTEPQLPPALHPERWTPPLVRERYDEFEVAFQARLRAFFATVV